ncbi:MAG: cell division protein ZapE [Gemmatimonadetes bacterium]|nr:cell division protein ZapE [Gemmatimonadota bacterium]
MLRLDELIAGLSERPDVDALLAHFVPPGRFAAKRFDNYDPRDPSQAAASERLRALAGELRDEAEGGLVRLLRARISRRERGSGVYLDGGFGVGKTHLLAAFWHAAPAPKAYLSFDELVYFIGLVGVEAARASFAGQRVAAIDEWELDDPGNLKIALAFLRGALEDGLRVMVTSNTLPLELGAGRFSQKDFRAEIEELASAFEVVRVEGTDYRHRRFEADPGKEYFLDDEALHRAAAKAGDRALLAPFPALIDSLARVHPIRYAGIVDQVDALFLAEMNTVAGLPEALRWVHFVDTLYDSAVPLRASSRVSLGSVFPPDFARGPYGKKISRCLSRLEEMLGEEG